MLVPYRLAYLGIIGLVVGGVAFVAAQADPAKDQPGLSLNLRGIQESQERLTAPPAVPGDGSERGNLSEAGAKEISTGADYRAAVAASHEKSVFVFKHSTTCSISGGAYRRVAAWMKERGAAAPPVYLVKVIERRPVSQQIAQQTKVTHESPQIILLQDGKAVWSTSHDQITAAAIEAALETKRDDSKTD
jgi:bacillithiol system protein YtxJ